ncbi:serpin B6-like [Pollicipes pollicipes]|uniref:serpin B6-like n=1 Tax=Pollicipes pollicipes TaxID=41117 RepID=UPI001884DAAD|nr:serpin B6-like [Pollicipes pollicipes]
MLRLKQGIPLILLIVGTLAGACVPNGLDLKLLKALTTDLSKNQAIAPFVMSTLMTQVWLGARGDTRNEITSVLDIRTKKGYSFLTSYKRAISDLSHGPSNITTGVFNRIYIKHGFSIKSGFKDLLQDYYYADVKQFSSPAQAAKEINSAVAKATKNRIKDLVSAGALQQAVMVLISALYFKGLWLTQFNKTVTEPFLTASGEESVDMMKLNTSVPYVKMAEFDAICLPYTDRSYGMLILRPLTRDMAAVSHLRDSLDSLDVANIMNKVRSSPVEISMPRFKIEAGYKLKKTISQLGIRKLFTARADLGNIADKPLAVSEIIHKVFMEVTEKGTEAAGAGAVIVVGTGSETPPPVQFTADRPFFVIVCNKKHRINLFSAYVALP